MARRRKPKGLLGALFFPIGMFTHYVTHYKPTPIVGSKRGRKKKH